MSVFMTYFSKYKRKSFEFVLPEVLQCLERSVESAFDTCFVDRRRPARNSTVQTRPDSDKQVLNSTLTI